MVKRAICELIKSNKTLIKLFVKTFNQFEGESFDFSGLTVRNNKFIMKGSHNIAKSGKNCSIQNNIMDIQGDCNVINLEDDVEFIGENNRSIFIYGNNNRVIVEKGCKLVDISFFILGNNNIIHISEGYSGIAVEYHIEQDNNEIYIGKNTTMHGRGARNIHFALDEGTKVLVGDDCMFSNDIQIRTSDSHSIVDLEGERLNHAKDIVIGNHCWLGMRSMLLKGTEISDNTIIAAGSICTRQYEESNVILAGNPVKVVKRNVNWDRKFI